MKMNCSYRIKNGWKQGTQEKDNICQKCFAKLWIAPDGKSVYCDNIHKVAK